MRLPNENSFEFSFKNLEGKFFKILVVMEERPREQN